MKHNSEIIVDENNIEILVGYDYEISDSDIQEGHGFHEVGKRIYTELKSVEIVFGSLGIDILPMLTELQIEFIKSKIEYK